MSQVRNLCNLALSESSGNPPGHHFAATSLSRSFGAVATGMGIYELPPGNASWPYHFELTDPDSGKIRVAGLGFDHRGWIGDEVEYWEGEP